MGQLPLPMSPRDWKNQPQLWAKVLGVSEEAVELYVGSDVIDLHIDSFIWPRVFGYDLRKRHDLGPLKGKLCSQLDLPRALESGLTAGVWSITTNPYRSARGRLRLFSRNLRKIQAIFDEAQEDFSWIVDASSYREAKAAGKQGVFLGIQGANGLDADLEQIRGLPETLIRVTLASFVHSSLCESSETIPSWYPRKVRGLTDKGREAISLLNQKKIFLDLAHISREGFFQAVEVHDPSQPLLISHTGADAVFARERNHTDAQLKAIAETGGVVGVIYKSGVIGPKKATTSEHVLGHMKHMIEVIGEDHVCLGADWDGVMTPPQDMPSPWYQPRLVQRMLDEGWSSARIQKILGANVLRAVEELRGS